MLTSEQKRAIVFPNQEPDHAKNSHLILEAGAGAGKTKVICERVLHLFNKRTNRTQAAKKVGVFTFSRSAAQELETRILSQETPKKGLSLSHQIIVSTLDGWFQNLVQSIYPHWWVSQKNTLRWGGSVFEGPCPTLQALPPTTAQLFWKERVWRPLLERLPNHSPDENAQLADFLLLEALEPLSLNQSGHSNHPGHSSSWQALCDLSFHPQFLLGAFAQPILCTHGGSSVLLKELAHLSFEFFLERLRQGQFTYSDKMAFLWYLFCHSDAFDGLFILDWKTLPGLDSYREILVDEYQDTNFFQHQILCALANHHQCRLCVVGDPKQSIYRFRGAEVSIMESLKTPSNPSHPSWVHLKLTSNFRSTANVLEGVNQLAHLFFRHQPLLLPPHCDSQTEDLIRSNMVPFNPMTPGNPEANVAGSHVTLMTWHPNLNRPKGEPKVRTLDFAMAHLAKTLASLHHDQGFSWSEMAVIVSKNSHCLKLQEFLTAHEIPATILGSKASQSPPEWGDGRLVFECGLFLKLLIHKLTLQEFCELFHSPLFNWSAHLIETICRKITTSKEIGFSSVEICIQTLHLLGQDLSRDQAWQPFWAWTQQFVPPRHLNDSEKWLLASTFLENQPNVPWEALQASSQWCVFLHQQSQNNSPTWMRDQPNSLLNHHLLQWNSFFPEDELEVKTSSVTLCTVHGAKGLEWPVVFYWPSATNRNPSASLTTLSTETELRLAWTPPNALGLGGWEAPEPQPINSGLSLPAQQQILERLEQIRLAYVAITRAQTRLYYLSPFPHATTTQAGWNEDPNEIPAGLEDELFHHCWHDSHETENLMKICITPENG